METTRKAEWALWEKSKKLELRELHGSAESPMKNEPAPTTSVKLAPRRCWQGTDTFFNLFVYNESKKLDGIIAYLTREYGGNVHDKGIVNVTACIRVIVTRNTWWISIHPPVALSITSGTRGFHITSKSSAWSQRVTQWCRLVVIAAVLISGTGSSKSQTMETQTCGRKLIIKTAAWYWMGDLRLRTLQFPAIQAKGSVFSSQTGKNHAGGDCLAIASLEICGTLFGKETQLTLKNIRKLTSATPDYI